MMSVIKHNLTQQVFGALMVLALLLNALPAFAAPAPAPAASADIGDWIVTLDDTARVLPEQAAMQAVERAGGQVLAVYEHALQGFAVKGASRGQLERLPGVIQVEPDLTVTSFAQTMPTGIDRIDAELNAIANIDGIDERVDIDVAVIDDGIDLDHPDLNVMNGVDCTTNIAGCISGGDDRDGHGTHVAGTIGALDNSEGVVGVAPGARLWAVKVLDLGSGSLSDVIEGVDYVTANASEIDVANMSLGAIGKSDAFRTAIQNSVAAGVVHVVAAGNDGIDVYYLDGKLGARGDVIPAAYPEVATISALADSDGQPGSTGGDFFPGGSFYTADDSFAPFSNYSGSVEPGNPVTSPGGAIDLMLPGVAIYSTYKEGGYATLSGTSMASPHAAGLAALLIAESGQKPQNAADVYALRQIMIDQAYAQDSAFGLSTFNDPDNNPEPLGYAPSGTTPEPVNESPIASFDYATSGLSVTFTDNSSDNDGSVMTWNWDFGDGNTSTVQNPTHTYAVNGSYTVTLIVTDNDGDTDTASQVVFVNDGTIEPVNEPPSAGFTLNATDLTVEFNDQSTDDGTIVSWNWDFGDGNTSTVQNPTHTYPVGGTYAVSLTVTDDAGETDTISQTVTVTEPVTSGITLSLSGTKERGRHVVTLNWSGTDSASVDIYRDDFTSPLDTVVDTGLYTDTTGNRGGATYTYQVCEAGTATCSDTTTISF